MCYCNIYDMQELGRVTLRQYSLMMRSVRLSKEDELRDMHLQAWLNQQVKATKRQGKKTVPVYKRFSDFCNVGEQESKKRDDMPGIKALMLRANMQKLGK